MGNWCRILDPKTLRGRLGIGYAGALIAALCVFALIALAVVDRAQRSALDQQLEATANAVRIVGDVRGTELSIDAKDREQFRTIVGTKAQSAIVALSGAILVSTQDRIAAMLATIVGQPNAARLLEVDVAGEHLRVLAKPNVDDDRRVGETLAWGDLDVIGTLDRSVALAFAIAIPLIAALAILAGGEIARRGLLPLDRIVTLASEIEGRDLSRRLGLPERSDELGKLAATFDRMLDRLENAFARERRFTSDASHELRAPLSVIRAEADLALRSERAPAEYRRALETIAAESDALEALTRDLLAAARDGADSEDVRAPVDLAHVATTVAERLSVLAGARQLRVHRQHEASVSGNRTLLERAVVSVVHNALKYAPATTGIVDIHVRASAERAELTVVDDGPGFSEAALDHGLERFWRDDEARASEGSGLGLSLAKTIVERYGGTIALANAQPHGAIVRMTFPAL